METKQITLTDDELSDIVFALSMMRSSIDQKNHPHLWKAMDKLHSRMSDIYNEWFNEIKEGAR